MADTELNVKNFRLKICTESDCSYENLRKDEANLALLSQRDVKSSSIPHIFCSMYGVCVLSIAGAHQKNMIV